MSIGHESRPKPSCKVAERHEAEYRRTLISLYVAMDAKDQGYTRVRNTRLAKEAGLSTKAVKRALEEMERRSVIAILAKGFGERKRIIVYLDHPDAAELIAGIKNDRY